MVESTTKNYGWVKPEVQHSPATWGGFLNNDLDAIDALVFANQQAAAPVGSGALWFTSTPPANWLICNGASLDTTQFATLFAVLGYAYGGSGTNFSLPDLRSRFPMGPGTLGAVGGEASHALTWAENGPHYHDVPDPEHYHTINQGSHTHGDYGHGHGINQSPHAHGGGVHDGGARNTGGYPPQAETLGGTDAINANISIQTGYANLAPSGTGVGNTDYAATRISVTDTQGSGAPHNNLPPYLQINFIVRYQ